MKHVLIWGAGRYGNHVYESLIGSTKMKVIGIYDKNEKTLDKMACSSDCKKIHATEDIDILYKMGKIDGVIIAVLSLQVCAEIEKKLAELKIPVIPIEGQFISADSLEKLGKLEKRDEIIGIIQGGYASFVSLYLPVIGLYDMEGNMLKESYTAFSYHEQFQHKMYFPLIRSKSHFSISDDCCVIGMPWQQNYWHFVFDAIVYVMYLESVGFTGKYLILQSPFAETYLRLLGIVENRIIYVKENEKRLYVLTGAVYIPLHPIDTVRAPYILRGSEIIMKNLIASERCFPKYLYVERIGSRKLKGCAKEILKEYGFESIVPENLSIEEQIAYFHAADVVVCPHGANSTNSIFMKKDSVFIECFGKSYIAPCCLSTILCQNIKYRMLVEFNGLDCEEEHMRYQKSDDFEISRNLLRITLNEVMQK